MLCVVPLKMTVLVFLVNVPLFVQFPLTVRVLDPVIINVELELMVILLQSPPAVPIVGFLVTLGITTFVEVVGTPPHQFDAVFQSVLVVPVQVPGVHAVPTVRTPVAVAK